MISTIGFTDILHQKIASKFNYKVTSHMLVVNDFVTSFGDRFRFIFFFTFSYIKLARSFI